MTDDPAIRRLVSQMPEFWHAEAKTMVARSIVNGTTAERMALDAMPDTLDADINRFFRCDQMPIRRSPTSDQVAPSSGAAEMPASFSDNYVGGSEYRRRNNTADQPQPYSAQAVISWVTRCLHECDDEQRNELLQSLADLLDSEFNGTTPAAEDQGSPMQFSNGAGTAPHELLAPGQGSSSGTWAETDPHARGPSGLADTARDRRVAQDASIRRRYANQAGFDQRFGSLVSHISVWR